MWKSTRRLPQDGRISINIGKKEVDLRVSTLPSSFGERVVLRILEKDKTHISLNDLGFSEDILVSLRKAFRNETSISSEKPRSFKLMCVLSFSSILRTTRSPKDDGKVETRKSTSFFPILIDIRPSCGSLRVDFHKMDEYRSILEKKK